MWPNLEYILFSWHRKSMCTSDHWNVARLLYQFWEVRKFGEEMLEVTDSKAQTHWQKLNKCCWLHILTTFWLKHWPCYDVLTITDFWFVSQFRRVLTAPIIHPQFIPTLSRQNTVASVSSLCHLRIPAAPGSRLIHFKQCTVPQCFQNNHVSFIWLIALVILVYYPPKWRQQCLADSGFGSKCCKKRIYGCIALKSMKSRARLPDLFENGKSLDILEDGQIQSWELIILFGFSAVSTSCISRLHPVRSIFSF